MRQVGRCQSICAAEKGCHNASAAPLQDLLKLTLARQLASTKMLGLLTSQCTSGGLDRWRYSRPRAASSATPMRRSHVRAAAHSGELLPCRSTSYRLPRAQYSAWGLGMRMRVQGPRLWG